MKAKNVDIKELIHTLQDALKLSGYVDISVLDGNILFIQPVSYIKTDNKNIDPSKSIEDYL